MQTISDKQIFNINNSQFYANETKQYLHEQNKKHAKGENLSKRINSWLKLHKLSINK